MIKAQLPDSVLEPKPYILSDNWAMSQKLDGQRVIVECGERSVKAYNRQGLERDLPDSVATPLMATPNKFIFDGELLGNDYWVFDIIEIPTGSIRSHPWVQRQELLSVLVSDGQFPNMHKVQQYFDYDAKQTFFERCVAESAEGVVFNSLSAPYSAGRSAGVLKCKFISEVDCFIIGEKEGDRDNFVLAVYRDGEVFPCGKVSALTGDGPDLKVGDVCTVECLYSTKAGRLFQPTKPRLRTDKSAEECDFKQIEDILVNKKVIS